MFDGGDGVGEIEAAEDYAQANRMTGVGNGSATMDTTNLDIFPRPDDEERNEPNARELRENGARIDEMGIRVQFRDQGERARGRVESRDVRAWAHFDTGTSAMGSPQCMSPRAEGV